MNERDYNEKRRNEIEIDVVPMLKMLLSKLWLILIVGVAVAGIVFCSTKMFIKPTYRCSFSAYVNNQHAQSNDRNSLTSGDLVAAQHLTRTLSYIIRSNTILSASLNSIDSDLSYDEFSRMVSTEIVDETELISIYVVNSDPQLAYDLANAIAKTAPSYMADIVEGSSMKIVDYPVFSNKRYKPSYIKYTILGFAIGVLLASAVLLIKYFRDDSIKAENELESRFSIPILGVIPDINNVSKNSGKYYYSSNYGYGYARASREKGAKK